MAAQDKELPRAKGNLVAPSYYDKTKEEYGVIEGSDGAIKTQLIGSNVINPVDIQSRYSQTIQGHSGASILPGQWNVGNYIDSHIDGAPLTFLGVRVNMTDGKGMKINLIFSDDGINFFNETTLYEGVSQQFATIQDIQLPARYFKLSVMNKDTTTPKTASSMFYLKA